MKNFTIIKVGYTAGVYGCSGEYFNAIWTTAEGLQSYRFYGMYGAEERISELFKKHGYKENYCSSQYGKMTLKDKHFFKSEHTALDELAKELE